MKTIIKDLKTNKRFIYESDTKFNIGENLHIEDKYGSEIMEGTICKIDNYIIDERNIINITIY